MILDHMTKYKCQTRVLKTPFVLLPILACHAQAERNCLFVFNIDNLTPFHVQNIETHF